jgi:uncharacterized protein involved in exopolysaccharide biosynthesis/Mrp family chromosome partitioning ATPase
MLQDKIIEQGMTPGQAAPATPIRDEKVDLKELMQVLWRRRAVIVWTAAAFVLLALAYSLLATPLYTASTQILIDPRDRNIVSNDVNPGALAPDGGVAVVESQLLVVTSDTVLRRAIAREHLAADPEFNGTSMTFPRRVLAVVGLDPDASDRGEPELKALRELKRKIGAKRSDKAFVVEVFVTTEAREKSVRIADAIAQSYLADQAEARSQAARQASASLGARLDELRSRVRDAENRVEQYRAQNNIVGVNGVLVSEQQLTDITGQLNAARAKTGEARARVEQIERLRRAGIEAGSTAEAVQSQTIGMLRAQYADAARQLADLSARVGPRHPSLATSEAQVRDLRRLIDAELTRIAAAARSDLERAQAAEQSLERSLDGLKKEAIANRQAFVRLRELEREVEAGRAVYESFLVRARETGEQQSVDTTNARVISSATPPRDKSWPPRVLILAIALVVGVGTGTGAGLLREYFDDRIHSRRQLQAFADVQVISALPEFTPRRRWFKFGRRTIGDYFGETGEQAGAVLVTAVGRVRDVLRELDQPRRGRTVLIASAHDGEGKTTVALHLARAAAAGGEKVLLVDADLDGRTASKLAKADTRAGFADLIEGRTILSAVVVNDDQTGINLVPAGNASRAETRRAGVNDILQRLIEPARSFDLVIIDAGALLAQTGVRPLADAVDDIVLVARAGITRQEDVSLALQALRVNARKIRGAVLNAAAAADV